MADTARVNISYRPLRIGWAVRSDDLESIRLAIRYSHALWGGRYNPIIAVDREQEADALVRLFRLDFIEPLGASREVQDFPKRHPHLITPFHGDSVFVRQQQSKSFCWALDIQNTATHWQHRPEWKQLRERGVRAYGWQADDPLADLFLMQLGGFPDPDVVGTDYATLVERSLVPEPFALVPNASIPSSILDRPGVSVVGRFGLDRDYTVRPGWDAPGFFVGSVEDTVDLLAFWNIRACDIPLWFVDAAHLDRFSDLIPQWAQRLQADLAHRRHEWDRNLGVWSRQDVDSVARHFPFENLSLCRVSEIFWNGGAVRAPVMSLGQVSTLGVMGNADGVPRVNFALADKPFASEIYFSQQHLVASLSLIGGLYDDEQHTFDVPWIPELNEFYARTMHYEYDKVRTEPERTGLIIDANDHDTFLTAMPAAALFKKVFSMAGCDSSLSSSGRIVRQLLTQLGGVQGARVFKIPGVRALLKTFGIGDTFTRENALEVIRDKSPARPSGTFGDHVRLFLEQRPLSESLSPPDVLNFMVAKGLFRIGTQLQCPNCDMSSWISIDALKQNVGCELCGNAYDATRQLVDFKSRFRRSGVLGAERNAQGAVPVALTLQQLSTTLRGSFGGNLYSPSLDVMPLPGVDLPTCEIDLVWMQTDHYSGRTTLVIAECKDKGPIRPGEFQRDVDNMRRIADAFPRQRFDTYVMFVKLAPFSDAEVAMLRQLNEPYRSRVILLTDVELEPYFLLERREAALGRRTHASTASELANITTQLYFQDAASDSAASA